MRCGLGVDVHRFDAARPLMLGGVLVPGHAGLSGHSDGDCALHAVADAILGALGLGDLGDLFPSNDVRWAGADSAMLLDDVAARMRARRWRIGNLDVTIVTERPRLAEHRPIIRQRLAEILGCSAEAVSVKAKSAEGLGAIGAGEALAALAVVLLEADPGGS